MGYYTSLTLNLELREGKKFSDFNKEIKKAGSDCDLGFYCRNKKLCLGDGYAKVYEREKMVNIIAKYFNGKIEGQGDESEDMWKFEMENGRIQPFMWDWVAEESYRVD
jgi:hypothetical protein